MKRKILLIDDEAASNVLLAAYLKTGIYSLGINYYLNVSQFEGHIELDRNFIPLGSKIFDAINVLNSTNPTSDKGKSNWEELKRDYFEMKTSYKNTFNLKMKVIDDFRRENNGIEIYVFYHHKGITEGVLEKLQEVKDGGFKIFLDLGFETHPFGGIDDVEAILKEREKIINFLRRYEIGKPEDIDFLLEHFVKGFREKQEKNSGGVFLGKRLMEEGIEFKFFTNDFGHARWNMFLLEHLDLIPKGTRQNCPANLIVSKKTMINNLVYWDSGKENFQNSPGKNKAIRELKEQIKVFLK